MKLKSEKSSEIVAQNEPKMSKYDYRELQSFASSLTLALKNFTEIRHIELTTEYLKPDARWVGKLVLILIFKGGHRTVISMDEVMSPIQMTTENVEAWAVEIIGTVLLHVMPKGLIVND